MSTIRNALILICSVSAMVALQASSAASVVSRVAQVIGNAHYDTGLGAVPRAVDDAKQLAETLKKTGFQVVLASDVDQAQMKRAIAVFGDKLVAAGPTATGLFFYTGHGVQIGGQNFLIPIGADIARAADVDLEAINLETILEQMQFAGAATNILMIDASRNNPLQRGFRSVSGGLAHISGSYPGVFISYAAAPGTVVIDSAGPHSAYVTALVDGLLTPGQNIDDLFRHVRVAVLTATKGRQVTSDSSTLAEPFYFVPQGN